MSPAHFTKHVAGYDRLKKATGPTGSVLPASAGNTHKTQTMSTTASNTFADDFRAKVEDHMRTTNTDFDTAWTACQRLYAGLWDAWQAHSQAANVRAANEKTQTLEQTAQTRSEALTEFNRQVNERMQSAGENYGAAHAFVTQTNPRLWARMNGDADREKELAEAGYSEPIIRK